MKRVFSSEALAIVGHLKNVLEQNGIDCVIKNEQLSGGLGELPFPDCLPELWVVRDSELPAAQKLIADLQAPVEHANPWTCATCGETNEGQYAACWNCGATDAG